MKGHIKRWNRTQSCKIGPQRHCLHQRYDCSQCILFTCLPQGPIPWWHLLYREQKDLQAGVNPAPHTTKMYLWAMGCAGQALTQMGHRTLRLAKTQQYSSTKRLASRNLLTYTPSQTKAKAHSGAKRNYFPKGLVTNRDKPGLFTHHFNTAATITD